MGRGVGWTNIEIGHLARAWLCASDDAIVGVDQTAARFRERLFDILKYFAPFQQYDLDETYGGRSAKSVRSRLDDVAADVQKCRQVLRIVEDSNPTSVSEDEKT